MGRVALTSQGKGQTLEVRGDDMELVYNVRFQFIFTPNNDSLMNNVHI